MEKGSERKLRNSWIEYPEKNLRMKRLSNESLEREPRKKTCLGTTLPPAHLEEGAASRLARHSSDSVRTYQASRPSYESPIISPRESLLRNGIESSGGNQSISTKSSHPCTLSSWMRRERAAWEELRSFFAVAESKRQVKTGGEWSAAFRRMAKAVAFLFPHRREELSDYAEHIESLFAAKHVNAHSKVILYDQSVRNRVGGGQNVLLSDYQAFSNLSEAILHADGIEYRGNGKGSSKGGKGSDEGGSAKKEVCRRFNSQDRCRFSEEECYYKHACKKC
jgi:hypothetical protein